MNWYILIPVGIILIGLVVFLIRRNQKDEKVFEKQLNSETPVEAEDEIRDENKEIIT